MHLFFLSVFFGLMPYNYLCVTSGVILSEIKTVRFLSSMTLRNHFCHFKPKKVLFYLQVGDILSWYNMGRCATIALAALVPTILRKYRYR